ncbi:hypothetical protein GV791_27225 [Nocardia cyriacigeorgica]|uniref:Uncharacterized protein n=2 Tax=Nocardia cyriacigeorgica TaxID=135487 RepID=H6R1N0_NOCCG|nr:hypothetical protein [Nocardia cyriacigeorgica]MBF6083556.1 hypothetical protein [Nocardia cyriacigeorgica]MBF6289067.1 hypothetical protein [Nocardia cyriacigeorgica]MBF6425611.1 hypothetical protein [Nocardia cyriacigeorgica]NEW36227.1 hypothetical protein [Nocardia cyriacigeorgica]CCF61764.1 conserved exported protein of unknown function [Nocardia cyriacigeorgica GUH-2]
MADNQTRTQRGPSFSLLIVGLLAVALSVWALIGPASWPATGVISIGWIVVVTAIVVGLLLVVSPRKRR